jgi:hypothetical protein
MDNLVSQPQYAYVKAVLLFREDLDRFGDHHLEIRKLKKLFQSLRFETQSYQISTDYPHKVFELVQDEHDCFTRKKRALGAPCLFIIYHLGYADKYGGDYTGRETMQHIWKIWRS